MVDHKNNTNNVASRYCRNAIYIHCKIVNLVCLEMLIVSSIFIKTQLIRFKTFNNIYDAIQTYFYRSLQKTFQPPCTLLLIQEVEMFQIVILLLKIHFPKMDVNIFCIVKI